jgi:hypothetical protein
LQSTDAFLVCARHGPNINKDTRPYMSSLLVFNSELID